MIDTLREFILQVEALEDKSDAFDLFEEECTQELRDSIYDMVDVNSNEPFRAAMIKMGYSDF